MINSPKLTVITHTLGTSKWMNRCVESVEKYLPSCSEAAVHQVIPLTEQDDFLQARWDAFQLSEYVTLVDDDDEVDNDSIRMCLAALETSGAGVAFTNQTVIDEHNEILRIDNRELKYSTVARSPQSIHHLAVVRRSAIDPELLDIAKEIGTGIEWLIKANAALRRGAIHVPIQGYKWRRHNSQHSLRDHRNFTENMGKLQKVTHSWLNKEYFGYIPQYKL